MVQTAADIDSADKVVFPGDGHFLACMNALNKRGLRDAVLRAAAKKPFFGICVGMQVLYESSEEAPDTPGLAVLPGHIRHLPEVAGKIPHMGWNTVQHTRAHPMLNGVPENSRFYFIHSYYAEPNACTIGIAEYSTAMTAIAEHCNVWATQFHPEKSGRWGAQLLKNFVAA
jgi:glutamine amidotransferase